MNMPPSLRYRRFVLLAAVAAVLTLPAVNLLLAEPAPSGAASAATDKDTGKLIVVKEDGLKYVDLVVGKGAEAKTGDHLVVQYEGKLLDGTKFDSSYDRGQPFELTLGVSQVIKGWTEGLAGMKPGGQRKLIIPPHLGYGLEGAGDTIPPNATLIFKVELVAIKP